MAKSPDISRIMAAMLFVICAPVSIAANKNTTGIDTALVSNGETFPEAQRICSELRARNVSMNLKHLVE